MSGLELRFLGDFAVIRDGQALPLPPSRKTRALLAYLAMSPKRFRREHLCELLWEIPDDPRGSLRWSLSKLRRLIDDGDRERVIADRLTVGIDASDIEIDVQSLHAITAGGCAGVPTAVLDQAAERYAGNFLEGLEFSDFHVFHAWCVAERERAARALCCVLRELTGRLRDAPERALAPARALVANCPYDEGSRAELIRLLVSAHHVDEAEQQYQLGVRMLREAGVVSSGALLQARRGPPADAPRPATTAPRPVAAAPTGAVERSAAAVDAIIGREAEVGTLAEAMSRVAQSARAEVILVRGEPGIGKTRLLEHVADLARDAGDFVLRSSAFESEAIRPFALWIDALRGEHGDAAKRIFGDTRIENREHLFSGLSELVGEEAQRRRAVLVFDDVHWCDESSAAALHYIVRQNGERPLLCVLSARDSELQDNVPLQQALRGLRHGNLLRELEVGPLAGDAISRLISGCAPGADSERLSRECGGNPLLAIELARAEQEGGGGGSLERLVRERLSRFDLDGAELLRWAAVLNPRIDVPTLAKLTGLDTGAVGANLENAERQSILASTDDGLRFSHELVARAVYTEISPVRRRVMHRRIAEMMEQDSGLDVAHTADLARHATQSGDPGLAARAMVSAGRLCLRFFANEEAASLARRGLQFAARLPGAEQVRLSIDLHDILLSASVLEDWEEAAGQYTELAERALDHGALAHARLGYHMAAYVRWAHGQWAHAREQSLQSERVVRGANDDDHIVGMAETARCLAMLERDLSQADAMLMEASALAERKGMTHRAIPAGLGMLRFHENRLDEAEELFQQARTLCKSAGDRIGEFQANEYLVMIDLQRGRFEDASRRCCELVTIGTRLREGSEAPFARALHGLCVYAIDDDHVLLDAGLADLRVADAKHRLASVLTRAALLDYERGRIDAAIAKAGEALGYARLLERATEMLLAHLVLALGCRTADDDARATEHLVEVARHDAGGAAEWARETAAAMTATERRLHG
jgi:DNA-binding SARP family transcriptional activator